MAIGAMLAQKRENMIFEIARLLGEKGGDQ
jgi:hypothetical protein